jgi:hypothetical protein
VKSADKRRQRNSELEAAAAERDRLSMVVTAPATAMQAKYFFESENSEPPLSQACIESPIGENADQGDISEGLSGTHASVSSADSKDGHQDRCSNSAPSERENDGDDPNCSC